MFQLPAPWKTCLTGSSSHATSPSTSGNSLAWTPLAHLGVFCRSWVPQCWTDPVPNLLKVIAFSQEPCLSALPDSIQPGHLSAKLSAASLFLLSVLYEGCRVSVSFHGPKEKSLYQRVVLKLLLVTLMTAWSFFFHSTHAQNKKMLPKRKGTNRCSLGWGRLEIGARGLFLQSCLQGPC